MLELAIVSQTKIPALVWGGPGVGKTSYIQSLGAALQVPVEVVIGSIREPSDFAGLPVVSDGTVRFAPPLWAQRLVDAGRGILFLDEVSTAPPAVQAALLRVILDRVVGELSLPEQVAIIAAANPPEQAAGGWELAAPLANRFVHLDWKLDAAAWSEGMVAGWPQPDVPILPSTWKTGVPITRALVASFIHAKPTLLYQFPKNESDAGRAWPSPRTWDFTATQLAACRSLGLADSDTVTARLLAGCVGDGAALEFSTWIHNLDLPDPEQVLANPDSLKLPARGDRAYAILSSVVAAVISRCTPDRWQAGCRVMGKAADQGMTDVGAAACKALVKHTPPNAGAPPRELSKFFPVLKAAGLIKV